MTKTFTAIIELEKVLDTKLGKMPAKELSGKQLSDGKPWKKAFFSNNKQLRDQLNDVEVGDTLAIEMVKDDKYWNIDVIRVAEEDEIEKAMAYAEKSERQGSSSKLSGGNVRRPDGGSRGDDTNRSAAIYLAREIVAMSSDKPLSADKTAEKVAEIADKFIYPYIKEGLVPVIVESKRKSKVADEDPLDPPDIDD